MQVPCHRCWTAKCICIYRPNKASNGQWQASACQNCYGIGQSCSASEATKSVTLDTDIEFVYDFENDDGVVQVISAPDLSIRVDLLKGLLREKKLDAWPKDWMKADGEWRHARHARHARHQLLTSHL